MSLRWSAKLSTAGCFAGLFFFSTERYRHFNIQVLIDATVGSNTPSFYFLRGRNEVLCIQQGM